MTNREFVITDGTKYVQTNLNGRYQKVNNLALADTYATYDLAKKVWSNSLPRSWASRFFVGEVIDGEVVQCNVPKQPKQKKSNLHENVSTKEISYHFENGTGEKMWYEEFSDIEGLFDRSMKRAHDLREEIGHIEDEINDLEHYIEFVSLNARDGYKMYRRLREVLRKRRLLKYEYQIVNSINDNYSASREIDNIIKSINTCKNYEYRVRVLPELFERGVDAII